jgi:hypothetical protein
MAAAGGGFCAHWRARMADRRGAWDNLSFIECAHHLAKLAKLLRRSRSQRIPELCSLADHIASTNTAMPISAWCR